MNVKKAIKRIVALGTGAALMGATVLGAMAADLANFPAPFVQNGQFNAMIIVGAAAKTPDVIGAVDIASTLQYEMKQAASASAAGTSTSVTVSGDNKQISLSNQKLTMGAYLGSVIQTMDKTDMTALADGTFDNVNYNQLLTLPQNAGGKVEWLSEGGNNHRSEPGLYLHFPDSQLIYTYELDFPTEAKSQLSGTDATDFDSQSLTMLGMKYDIVSTYVSGNDVKLTLMGGAVDDVLNEFDEKTYTVSGKSYDVKAIYVGTDSAKFTVNGQTTNVLKAGETAPLTDGTQIGVREVLAQGSNTNVPDMVEFYLGANKVILEDTNVANPSAGSTSLQVGDTTYSGDQVSISGSVTGTSSVSLDSIKIAVTSDNDYYLASGEKLSQYLDGSGSAYLFGSFDFLYSGMTQPKTDDITLNPVTDHRYELDLTNKAGVAYNVPVWNATSVNSGLPGGSDFALFVNQTEVGASPLNATPTFSYNIGKKDEFLVTTGNGNPQDKTGRFFSFDNWNPGSSSSGTLTIRDEGTGGGSKDLTLKNDTTWGGANTWEGSTVVDGVTHQFYLNDKAGTSAATLWVNMSGSSTNVEDGSFGLASGSYVRLVPTNAGTNATNGIMNIQFGTPGTLLSGSPADPKFTIQAMSGSQTSGYEVTDGSGPVSVTASAQLTNDVVVNTNYDTWYTVFGTKIVKDRSGNQDRVTITMPYEQALPQVFATSGSVTASTVQGASSGAAYTIAPVKAGIAMLDTEVGSTWQNNNVIVVGGPCVNTVAAALLGNPATCTDGFTQGQARIQLFSQTGGNVAMLVAGYSADDTRRAATVVHNFRNYASSFKGTEVQVSGTSMSDITVTSVQ